MLYDNSFLTHLATGRLIVDGHIPRADPYTFTAAGEPWVVQSWLASGLYGLLDQLGGLGAIRLLMVVTCAALGAACWGLTRPAPSLLVRLGLTGGALLVGTGMWPHRPLLLGLLFLAAVLFAAEGRLDPRLLAPLGWLWANTHGSWPMGLVAVGCLWLGARLDGDDATGEWRAGLWLTGGVLAGVVNPYGPAILLFPIDLLSRREALEGIVEWQAMSFSRLSEWVFLALLLGAIVAVRRQPAWRATIPLVVFGAAAVTGVRNVPMATLVLLPGLARGLGDLGGLRWEQRSPLARPLVLTGVVLVAASAFSVGRTDHFSDDSYPVAADEWLRDNDLDPREHRIVARELVGNWFEARYGVTGNVFIDDRAEVMPIEVVRDHRTLLRGGPGWDEVLARHSPDAVLWEVDSPLAELLASSADWTITYREDEWLVAVPS